jgi:hypothetical protein
MDTRVSLDRRMHWQLDVIEHPGTAQPANQKQEGGRSGTFRGAGHTAQIEQHQDALIDQ